MSRDTTNFMRSLNFLIDSSILGVTSDVSRPVECINKINEHMNVAVVSKYVNLFLNPGVIGTVDGMVQNIKIEFVEMLQRSKWLSLKTKYLAIEKIIALKHYVGYPKWAENATFVDEYYEKVRCET